jgi:pyruvate carboxylase
VILKAAAGGGGRGVRGAGAGTNVKALMRCQSEAGLRSAMARFVEKLVARPRHIEVQILGDAAGNVVHLHERDYSVELLRRSSRSRRRPAWKPVCANASSRPP